MGCGGSKPSPREDANRPHSIDPSITTPAIPKRPMAKTQDRTIVDRASSPGTLIDQHAENYHQRSMSPDRLAKREPDDLRLRHPAIRRHIASTIIDSIIDASGDRSHEREITRRLSYSNPGARESIEHAEWVARYQPVNGAAGTNPG
ncbi:hypothetical protein FGG08_005650 [Glutinoglossum americanum]|uniref:Uncharacterized protein n=1 Tax=Glutinoglossum americanum TaxID=1670608 RepID=A0A9P8I2U3_9PEZI|nr:hypothetical protein FGG08_005650 [Glutinoglossum americanum]